MTATAEEHVSFFAFPSSQLFAFYSALEKCALKKPLYMELVSVLAFSIFVLYSRLQKAEAALEGTTCLR